MCRVELLDFRKNFVALTMILCLLICVCSVLAVGVPQWITITPNSVSFGLFKTCVGSNCQDNKYPVRVGCRSGSEARDRMSTSAGTLIIAVILNGIVAFFLFLDILRCVRMTRYGRFWIFAFSLAGVFFALSTLSITGDTFDRWMYCGTSFCDQAFPGVPCGQGYSYILAIVATILVFVITVLYCIDTCRMTVDNLGHDARPDANRTIFLYTACFVLCGACVLYVIALSTPEWYVAHADRVAFGLFQSCVGTTCEAHNFPDGDSRTTTAGGLQCFRNLKDFQGRLGAVAAFVFIPMLLSLAIFVLFLLKKCGCIKLMFTRCTKIVVVTLMWVCFVAQFVALVLFSHTVDSWYFCGMTYCDVATQGSGVACGKGLSYGLTVVAVIASFFLALMHLFELNDWACFSARASAKDPFGVQGSAIANAINGVSNDGAPATRYTSSGKRIPDGDWDHDAVSGYYYSESKYLFWDPESGMYYCPSTETWRANP